MYSLLVIPNRLNDKKMNGKTCLSEKESLKVDILMGVLRKRKLLERKVKEKNSENDNSNILLLLGEKEGG